MSIECKNCGSEKNTKNGYKGEKQRYKCKDCGYNFVCGDNRINLETKSKRAFAVLLYSVGSCSMRFIARLLGVNPSTVLKWLRHEADKLEEPEISSNIKEIEFDEMWHFIGKKKTKNGSLKPMIALAGELSHGLQAVVMLRHSEDFTTR